MTEPVKVAGIGLFLVASGLWAASLIRDRAEFEQSLEGNWSRHQMEHRLHLLSDGTYRYVSENHTVENPWHTDGNEIVLEKFHRDKGLRLKPSPSRILLTEGKVDGYTFHRLDD